MFCTLNGKPHKQAYIRSLLPRLAQKAGIGKHVHADGLRHTYPAELAQERIRVNVLAQHSGMPT